jgi:hypothetical protein
MVLEWRDQVFEVKNCASCPGRRQNLCLPRKVRLRRAKGAFPKGLLNPCPVHAEGKGQRRLIDRPMEAGGPAGPKWPFPVSCSWCGRAIDPKKAVLVVNDSEPNRIYDRFECLEQYLRTNNK